MLIETRGLTKRYGTIRSLNGVSVDIARGAFIAITGASGSGKSTLLNLLGCLDRPSEGQYRFDGADVTSLGDAALARIRSREFGFVFQSYNLLARASALQNVELPMLYSPVERHARSARARALLERVGLGDRLNHRPSELSGGEQQRVAVARALANGPSVLFADEPTGALDAESGASIMGLFEALHRDGLTIIFVTHDEAIARRANRRLRFVDGALMRAECDAGSSAVPVGIHAR